MNNLSEELIAKFLRGECSEKELIQLNIWIKESDKNARELFRLEEAYYLGRENFISNEKQIDLAKKKLYQKIAKETTSLNKIQPIRTWMKYAAVIAVILLSTTGVGYWFYQEINDQLLVCSAKDEVKQMELPDGTKVWLNKYATLKYPRNFSKKERIVFLDGEAYFEVTKNPENPFIVQSNLMKIRVLGTTFNFRDKKSELSAEATLIEGEIEVKGNNDEGMIVLSPGQKAELNQTTRRLVVKQVNAKLDAVWHNNLIPFEKATIQNIAQTLERFYKVKIIMSPDISIENTYSGTLTRKDSIESILKSLKNAIPIHYKIVGNNVFISEQTN